MTNSETVIINQSVAILIDGNNIEMSLHSLMNDKLAIIVPYRDREEQLNTFVPHMHEFLKDKGVEYDIFIAEQSDDRPFNYGKLCNSVVKELDALTPLQLKTIRKIRNKKMLGEKECMQN